MDLRQERFLVTGAGGLIGAAIIDFLLMEGIANVVAFEKHRPPDHEELISRWDERVHWVDGDITSKENLARAMKNVDGVFHTAALLTPAGFENPRAIHEVNTNGTLNILETCVECGVRRIVFSSSVSVYGKPQCDEMDENHPFNTVTMYGASKVTNEMMCRVFHELYKIDYVSLRYTLIYGPRLHRRANNSAFMLDTIQNIHEGRRPVIDGDGSQLYDYLCIEDVARANVISMKSDITDEAFNIGYGKVFSVTRIVEQIMEIMQSDEVIEYRARGDSFDIPHIRVKTEKARSLLGFDPHVSIEEGFSRLIEWYLARLGSNEKSKI